VIKADQELNNDQFESEVINETELLKLDRSLNRINKFAQREILATSEDEHLRREKRY